MGDGKFDLQKALNELQKNVREIRHRTTRIDERQENIRDSIEAMKEKRAKLEGRVEAHSDVIHANNLTKNTSLRDRTIQNEEDIDTIKSIFWRGFGMVLITIIVGSLISGGLETLQRILGG